MYVVLCVVYFRFVYMFNVAAVICVVRLSVLGCLCSWMCVSMHCDWLRTCVLCLWCAVVYVCTVGGCVVRAHH